MDGKNSRIENQFKVITHEEGYYAASYLSQREIDCLYWAGKGMCTKQIAKLLNVSPETIRTHKKSILAKSESANFIEAAVKLLRRKF